MVAVARRAAAPDLGRDCGCRNSISLSLARNVVLVNKNANTEILGDQQKKSCSETAQNAKERVEWESHFSGGARLLCFLHYKVSLPSGMRERGRALWTELSRRVLKTSPGRKCIKSNVELSFKHQSLQMIWVKHLCLDNVATYIIDTRLVSVRKIICKELLHSEGSLEVLGDGLQRRENERELGCFY